jgi:hypothetical protein
VDEFLANENSPKEELPDSVVSFCIIVEKILKIKLHGKNPFLVFEESYIKENSLSIIALRKEKDIPTAKIQNIIDRFKVVFKTTFTPDELQALRDIYDVRNCFVHGYKSDNKIPFDSEDIVKKMGTIWEKVSKIAISLFGKESIKNARPKKKYTEKELEKALEDEVRKMIQHLPSRSTVFSPVTSMIRRKFEAIDTNSLVFPSFNNRTTMGVFGTSTGNKCPRCDSYSFSLEETKTDWPYLAGHANIFINESISETVSFCLFVCADS